MNGSDLTMMARCIELSRFAAIQRELPFACVICKDGDIVVEATNRVKRDADVTRHAEMVAISKAQRKLGKKNLSRCTLYSNVEPCAMCSYCIRETRIVGSFMPSDLRSWADSLNGNSFKTRSCQPSFRKFLVKLL